jgi:DNA-binding transcriptional MerR regulator
MEEGTNIFSIKDLENFSGIKAHTIRIWEKRYQILEPDRTESNIRTYSESELKKILNVAYLNRNGMKISKIAGLDEDELTQQVIDVSSRNDYQEKDFQPGKMLMSAIRFNEELFKESLLSITKAHGLEEAYPRYFYPLLEKARILWQTGSLSRAQEQFVRTTIRQVIIMEDNQVKLPSRRHRSVFAMINTSDAFVENNFLFYKYALRNRGHEVIFTGGILPASEVVEIHKIKSFDYLIVNASTFDFVEKMSDYFMSVGKSLMLKKIIFTDSAEGYERKEDIISIAKDPTDFIKTVEKLR